MGRLSRQSRIWIVGLTAVMVLAVGWRWVAQALGQLFLGLLVALIALPLMQRLDKRMNGAMAATLSLLSLSATLALAMLALIPPLMEQSKQLASFLPGLYAAVEGLIARGEEWLAQSGLPVEAGWKQTLLERLKEMLGSMAPWLMSRLSAWAGSLGRWMLAPVFAFYFLRDRQRICSWMLSFVPAGQRAMVVRMTREIRRETAGYVRGQLLVSAVVGGLTGLGMLFCGVPGWLLLGVVMGVLELIPYVGPVLGGVLVALFALPGGLARTLWALGVVLVVQQLEGSMLSPQLVSDATRLHPVVVLLLVALGGAAAGITGILLAVPALLCVRAALRIVRLSGLATQET